MNENEFEQQNDTSLNGELNEGESDTFNEPKEQNDSAPDELCESEDKQAYVEEKSEGQDKKPKKQYVISYFKAMILVLLTAILVFQITYLSVGQKYQRELKLIANSGFSNAKLEELMSIYKENFIYDFTDEEILNGLIKGFIYGTGDKYGQYYTAQEYSEYIAALQDKAVGIGIIVGNNTSESSIEVYKVHENSPADKAGIKAGDHIIAVEDKTVADVGYEQATDMIMGEIGTDVLLTVKNDVGTSKITVTRNEYTTTTVDHSIMNENVGYIKISNFYANTPKELKNAVSQLKLQGAENIIFDVRDNTGGSLASIKETLEYLLPKGVMFRIVDKAGNEEVFKSDGPGVVDIPMVVLTNSATASAAELFTSALTDYDMAVTVGTKTHGKGSVSTPFRLSDGSYVYISASLYYPPSSDNFDGEGIYPDHKVELTGEAARISLYKLPPEKDAQLQYALKLFNK